MDQAIHGRFDTTVGDQEFKLSLDLFNKVLDKATQKFPESVSNPSASLILCSDFSVAPNTRREPRYPIGIHVHFCGARDRGPS